MILTGLIRKLTHSAKNNTDINWNLENLPLNNSYHNNISYSNNCRSLHTPYIIDTALNTLQSLLIQS